MYIKKIPTVTLFEGRNLTKRSYDKEQYPGALTGLLRPTLYCPQTSVRGLQWRQGVCSDRGRTSKNLFLHKSSNTGKKKKKKNCKNQYFQNSGNQPKAGNILRSISSRKKAEIWRDQSSEEFSPALCSSPSPEFRGHLENQQLSSHWTRQRGLEHHKAPFPENRYDLTCLAAFRKNPIHKTCFYLTGLRASRWEKSQPQDICWEKIHSCLG